MNITATIIRLAESDLRWLTQHSCSAGDDGGAGDDGSASDDVLAQLQADRAAAWFNADNPEAYPLEEAFAGVHYLLSGGDAEAEGPLGFIANKTSKAPSGAAASPRVLGPREVTAIADAIESMSAKVVRQRLDSDELSRVYPFSAALSDDDKEWLLAVLQGLMTFVRQAASDGASLLVATETELH